MSSKCYKNQDDTPEKWIKEVIDKGLQCIAVTDHNDYRGINEIKKLGEESNLIVFPGVELSCSDSKIHMLIIFDVTCSEEDVHDFLAKVNIFSESLGDSAKTCQGDIFEVCKTAHEMRALVIAAHIDEFNGVGEISFDNIKAVLDREYIDAVQVVNKNYWNQIKGGQDFGAVSAELTKKYGKEISVTICKEWYKVYNQAIQSKLPILTFSDNPCGNGESKHGLWGIGRQYSWLKMSNKPNLESVRQALLSYDMRTRSWFENTDEPDMKPELWIKEINIQDTSLNNGDVKLSFNPQLNTIIGGRGSGKSFVIRTLAGATLSFNTNIDAIKDEQTQFYKEIGKDNKGIFKTTSKIEIYIERVGESYKLVVSDIKSMENQNRTLYKLVNGVWTEIADKNVIDFFKLSVYTQKQIYEIARDPHALLSIVDEAIEDLSKLCDQKDGLLSDIISKQIEIWNLDKSIDEEEKIRSEITDIGEQIKKYEKSGIADALASKQNGDDEKKTVDNYVQERKNATDKILTAIQEYKISTIDIDSIRDDEIRNILSENMKLVQKREQEFLDVFTAIKQANHDLEKQIQLSEWQKKLEENSRKYNEASKLLQEQGLDSTKLDELLERKKNKLDCIDKIEEAKKKKTTSNDELLKMQDSYKQCLEKITKARGDFIRDIVGKDSNVKFDVQRGRNRDSFIEMMKSVLNKDNLTISDDINKLAEMFFDNDGITAFRKLMNDTKEKRDTSTLMARTRAAIIDTQPEAFARMISFLPGDDLRVSYKPENSKNYIPLSSASAGQKTTAILTFLLSYGVTPLLLDQPEDDLDNKLVYDLIVTRLKKSKSRRQIIVVTHNANIPVNADAEFIVSMNSESDMVSTKYVGTMDDNDIRKEVCDVMEGTKDAFEMRAKKYHFRIQE
jgi:energy-coupling factor transporter ATP-binding protein EcfA2